MPATTDGYQYAYLNVGMEIVPIKDGRHYAYLNVGMEVVPTKDGRQYAYLNVGMEIVPTKDGRQYAYLNVDGTIVPTPEIWAVEPVQGASPETFKVFGSGLGATQAEYNGVIKLRDVDGTVITCTVVSWARVAADPAQPFPRSIEHEEIVAVVPSSADDGEARLYVETNA